MSEHRFRNPDKFEQRPERDYIRKHCPNGRDGFVAEDLDLLQRVYGPRFQTDDNGLIRFVEIKHGTAPLGPSKLMTFGLVDYGLRRGLADRYKGFYVVRSDDPDWERASWFTVNDWELSREEFTRWLNWELLVPPMDLGSRLRAA